MPPAERACSKCGYLDIGTSYHPQTGYRACMIREEHLHHVCRKCHYDWTTPTLDTIPPPVETPETE